MQVKAAIVVIVVGSFLVVSVNFFALPVLQERVCVAIRRMNACCVLRCASTRYVCMYVSYVPLFSHPVQIVWSKSFKINKFQSNARHCLYSANVTKLHGCRTESSHLLYHLLSVAT